MDASRFDQMARGLDARLTRRHAGALATGALLALGLTMESDAKKKKLKKKARKLRKQSATPGACSQPPPPPTCIWTNQTAFGSEGCDHPDFPRGVAVTPDGQTAVVSDFGNDRMSVWAPTCTD